LKAIYSPYDYYFIIFQKYVKRFAEKSFLVIKVFDCFCYFVDKILSKVPVPTCFYVCFFQKLSYFH